MLAELSIISMILGVTIVSPRKGGCPLPSSHVLLSAVEAQNILPKKANNSAAKYILDNFIVRAMISASSTAHFLTTIYFY
jgi:hypothetical protein